mgnify:CR=1 FL=1
MKLPASVLRLIALTRKESHQLMRDKSSLAIGLILPIILILLFGYGLSFDLSNGRVGVVVQNMTPQSNQFITGLNGTPYITATVYQNFHQAEQAIRQAEIDAIVVLPSNFAEQSANNNAHVQIISNGRSTSMASALQGYVIGALTTAQRIQADRSHMNLSNGIIVVEQRMWFNESANSTWFLVPGLIVLVLTLIGAFLTGLLIARERERGTLEALFVTPVRPLEIVLAKLIPYIVIGMVDIVMCLFAASLVFDVPIRGSLLSIISVAWFKRSALIELRDHVNRISTVQLGKGWAFTLTVITSLILLTTLSMTIFNLLKNGYDSYSMSLQGVFGWGSVIFCAVVAIVLSKMKDR